MCYWNSRQLGLLQFTTACYYNLRQLGYYNSRQLLLQFTTDITIHGIITIRLRQVGPAVVPRFETCGKRVKKQRVHPTLTAAVIFFCFINERFVGKCSFSFLRTELVSLFGADSLSRSVHCAPDENDRPSEQTKIFKLTSVYVPVYISELTRT